MIRWGIIGCGDVTEIKSGPAFNRVNDSHLVAVMRRNAKLARDYATRHNVPKWYSNALELIKDPEVNAIYVATPPSSHEEYAAMAFEHGKPVYLEKPMAGTAAAAARIVKSSIEKNCKLVIAHYRRAQPFFRKIKTLIDENAIGEVLFAKLELSKKALTPAELTDPKIAWRVDPAIAGGGLFHDLAPHQLDLACYFFGEVVAADGIALNKAGIYAADDVVAGNIVFENNVLFNGTWNFTLVDTPEKDRFEITGTKGSMAFEVFNEPAIELIRDGKAETIRFDRLQHVQEPMIGKVVRYFLDDGPNPCSGEQGVKAMELIEKFTSNNLSGI